MHDVNIQISTDNIEANVEIASNRVSKGNSQLNKAVKYKVSTNDNNIAMYSCVFSRNVAES